MLTFNIIHGCINNPCNFANPFLRQSRINTMDADTYEMNNGTRGLRSRRDFLRVYAIGRLMRPELIKAILTLSRMLAVLNCMQL